MSRASRSRNLLPPLLQYLVIIPVARSGRLLLRNGRIFVTLVTKLRPWIWDSSRNVLRRGIPGVSDAPRVNPAIRERLAIARRGKDDIPHPFPINKKGEISDRNAPFEKMAHAVGDGVPGFIPRGK